MSTKSVSGKFSIWLLKEKSQFHLHEQLRVITPPITLGALLVACTNFSKLILVMKIEMAKN